MNTEFISFSQRRNLRAVFPIYVPILPFSSTPTPDPIHFEFAQPFYNPRLPIFTQEEFRWIHNVHLNGIGLIIWKIHDF